MSVSPVYTNVTLPANPFLKSVSRKWVSVEDFIFAFTFLKFVFASILLTLLVERESNAQFASPKEMLIHMPGLQ